LVFVSPHFFLGFELGEKRNLENVSFMVETPSKSPR